MRSTHKISRRHRIIGRIITTMGSRMKKFRMIWLKARYRKWIMDIRHGRCTATIILLRSMFITFIMTTRLFFLLNNHHISTTSVRIFARMFLIILGIFFKIFKSLSQWTYMDSIDLGLNTVCFLFLARRLFSCCFFIVLITLDIRCHESTHPSALLSACSLCYWKIIYSLMSLFT